MGVARIFGFDRYDTEYYAIRVGLPGRGKSGGARVIYVYLPHRNRVYLLLVYPKRVAATLSDDGKKILKGLIATLKVED